MMVRPPGRDEADEALPERLAFGLRRRSEPEAAHLIAEPPDAQVITRDGVVV